MGSESKFFERHPVMYVILGTTGLLFCMSIVCLLLAVAVTGF